MTKEEKILNNIVNNCNEIISQLTLGAEATASDFDTLGYIDSAVTRLKNKVYENLDNQIVQDVNKAKNEIN